MVDMHLGYEFFRRVKPASRILLVGDVDQLPSVGAGDVFRQLIGCGLIPVTVLDLVFVIVFGMGVAGVAYATIIAQRFRRR